MSTMPQPPLPGALPELSDVQGAGSGSNKDRVASLLNRLTGGGMGETQRQLDVAHQTRLANVALHQRNYTELSKALAMDPDNKYHNAEDGSLNEAGQMLEMQRRTAYENWSKEVGVNKDAKSIAQRVGEVADHIVHHRTGGQPQMGGGAQAEGTAPASGGGMPPPPARSATANPNPAPAASPAPAAAPATPKPVASNNPTATPGTKVAPNEVNPETALGMQQAAMGVHVERAKKEADTDVEIGKIQKEADALTALGNSKEQVAQAMLLKHGGAGYTAMMRPKPHPVQYTDPNDPTRMLPGIQEMNPFSPFANKVFDTNGEIVENPGKIVPGMLPTASSSYHNADTGVDTHSSQKVLPGKPKGGGGQASSPAPAASAPFKQGATGATAPTNRQEIAAPTPATGGETPTVYSTEAKPGGRVEAEAKAYRYFGTTPPAKDAPAVQRFMDANQWVPGVKPTVADIKLMRDIKKVAPMADTLQNFIEQNQLEHKGEGGMFNPSALYSAGQMRKAWYEYDHGIKPSDTKLAELIRYAAAIKIMGAAPWMTLGRSKYTFEQVTDHLPKTTDTPALLYSKIIFFKQILDDAKGSLPPQLQVQFENQMPKPPGGGEQNNKGYKESVDPHTGKKVFDFSGQKK